MADITLVGSVLAGNANNGGDVTLTMPAEITAGDTVIVFGGHPHRAGAPIGPSTSGYTQAFTPFQAVSPNFGAWYKVMGGTPDASVVLQGTANTNDGVAYGGWVLRNVNPGSVLDTTSVTTGPTTSTNPDALEITTVTNGAWVLVIAISNNADGSPGAPSNYENAVTAVGADAVNTSIGGATRVITTAGAENPGAFPTWDSGTWYAAALAIRPLTSTNGGTGILTAAAGPLGGTTSNGGGGTLTAVA